MCMLCVIPPHTTPTRERLENSALNNPHGFGFGIAIPSEKRIHVERTMNPDTSINRFLELRAKYPEGYAVWHARLATHGSTNVDNCHPFRVGKDNLTYLAHNGILPVIETDAERSDTRIFAEDTLPAMGGVSVLDNDQVLNVLEDFTSGSKVAILTLNPAAKHQLYLLHENKGWTDDTGVWWSNDTCKAIKSYSSYTYYGSDYSNSWHSDRDYDFYGYTKKNKPNNCLVCSSTLLTEKFNACNNCLSCQECYMFIDECECEWSDKRKDNSKNKGIHAIPLSQDTQQVNGQQVIPAWDIDGGF